MIAELKKELLKDPESIRELLEEFGFEHINIRGNYLRFARNHEGGQNISLCLDDEYLNVMDFVHGERKDIISYIISEKNTDFKSVLNAIKRILNLSNDWTPTKRRSIFGGVYEKIVNRESSPQKVYDEEILNQYLKIGNDRFLKDHLSLESQRRFEIMYNVETNRIIIPIRNTFGDLCGMKCRRNYDTNDTDDPKYIFEYPCQKSLILYGAFQNYKWLYGADKVFIFEAEKSTIAADSYGYRNAVSIMGNTLSEVQAKELLSLNAKEYVFLLDDGLDLKIIFQNAKKLKEYAVMRDIKISYFDWTESLSVGEKESPTDGGKNVFEYIINNELKKYK